MKTMMVFKTKSELESYFGDSIPSKILAIVEDAKTGSSYVTNALFSATNNIDGSFENIGNSAISYIAELNEELPTGYTYITANGDHDIASYAMVNVAVPVPAGYIIPEGELEITAEGEYDVTSYASVKVQIASTVEPVVEG